MRLTKDKLIFMPHHDRFLLLPEGLRQRVVKKHEEVLSTAKGYGIKKRPSCMLFVPDYINNLFDLASDISVYSLNYVWEEYSLTRGYKKASHKRKEAALLSLEQALCEDLAQTKYRPLDLSKYPEGGTYRRKKSGQLFTHIQKVKNIQVGVAWDYKDWQPSYWIATFGDFEEMKWTAHGETAEEAYSNLLRYLDCILQRTGKDLYKRWSLKELSNLSSYRLRDLANCRRIQKAETARLKTLISEILYRQNQLKLF